MSRDAGPGKKRIFLLLVLLLAVHFYYSHQTARDLTVWIRTESEDADPVCRP